MTTYKQNLVAWGCIVLTGFVLIALSIYASTWFIVPFVLLLYGSHLLLRRIVCQSCGQPVTYEGDTEKSRFLPPTAFLRTHCAKCGWDLDKQP